MITKAYRALKSLRSNGTQSNTFPSKSFKDISGTNRSINTSGSCYTNNPIMLGMVTSHVYTDIVGNYHNGGIGIFVGSGNTPATDDDYVLENPLTSSTLSRTSSSPGASAILDNDGNIIGVRRTVTYQNITGNNVTINEIGTYWKTTSDSGNLYYVFLIERTVLDTPVVLAPNDTITVAFDETY